MKVKFAIELGPFETVAYSLNTRDMGRETISKADKERVHGRIEQILNIFYKNDK